MRRFLAFFIFGIALAWPASADAKIVVELHRENISIGSISEEIIKRSINFIYHFYEDIFHFPSDVDIEIRIYGDAREFEHYRDLNAGPVTASGFYLLMPKRVVVNGGNPQISILRTLFHESSHAILHDRTAEDFPAWIDEGLAEYLETLQIGSRTAVIDPQPSRYEDIQGWLAQGTLTPLQEYFSLSNNEWYRDGDYHGDPKMRSMAWSLVFFLMSSGKGQEAVMDYLKEIRSNPDPAQTPLTLLERSYGDSVENLEKEWHRFLAQEKPESHRYPIPSENIQLKT